MYYLFNHLLLLLLSLGLGLFVIFFFFFQPHLLHPYACSLSCTLRHCYAGGLLPYGNGNGTDGIEHFTLLR